MYQKPDSKGGYPESHKEKGIHTCNQSLIPPVNIAIEDAQAEMNSLAKSKAIKEAFKTASEIAESDEVLDQTQQQYKEQKMMQAQASNYIHQTSNHIHMDWQLWLMMCI